MPHHMVLCIVGQPWSALQRHFALQTECSFGLWIFLGCLQRKKLNNSHQSNECVCLFIFVCLWSKLPPVRVKPMALLYFVLTLFITIYI